MSLMFVDVINYLAGMLGTAFAAALLPSVLICLLFWKKYPNIIFAGGFSGLSFLLFEFVPEAGIGKQYNWGYVDYAIFVVFSFLWGMFWGYIVHLLQKYVFRFLSK